MAGIDKTYTKSWKEYKEVIDWAENTKFVCPNGQVLYPINSCYEASEESFDGEREIAIMNSSTTLDYFLIRECPLEVVQKRMREVYPKDYYESVRNGTSDFDNFTKEGKIATKVKYNAKHAPKKTTRGGFYWVEAECEGMDYLWYDNYDDMWIWPNELGIWNTNAAHSCHSLKALRRKILKWKLPKGTVVKAMDFTHGYEYEFKCQ